MKNIFISLVVVLVLAGCKTLGYKQNYHQAAPTKYPATSDVLVFEYKNVNLDEIYDLLFSEFLIIGKSSFTGRYENPESSVEFAKSIGSDILLATSQLKEERISFRNVSKQTSNTTFYEGGGSVSTSGTTTKTVPVTVNHYNQNGIFLKNINGITPLWEHSKDQYNETEKNTLTGNWKNDSYEIELFQSGNQIVAFLKNKVKGNDPSNENQLKLIYYAETGIGVYISDNKAPIPSHFSINKFGFLEVKFLTNSNVFSFAKMP